MQERVSSGFGRLLPPRKASLLAAMVAAGALFYSALAPALGLGDISLHSSLNQPLNADIELVDAEGLDRNDLAVGLATADEYARAGIDRAFFLNDLRFSPVFRGGRKFIHVTSVKPVTEPYLSFLVQVSRPGGQLLRDYTVLLDPAGTVPLAPATIPTGAATQAEQGSDYTRAAATPTPPPPAAPKPAAAAKPAAALPPATENKRYSVEAGDTLWSVTKKLNAAGTPTAPNRLARELRALNPGKKALQKGQSLLLPDTAVLPQDAPAALAPAPDTAGSAPAGPAGAGQTPEQLAATVIQNQQLQQRLDDAQARLQAITEQDALKDRQLADLQARLAANGAVAPVPGPAGAAPVSPGNAAPATAAIPGASAPAGVAAGAVPNGAAPASGAALPNNTAVQATAPNGDATTVAASPAPATTATPAPARPAVTPPPAAPAPVADDDNTWLMIAGALAIVLLLLVMLLLARRRRAQQQESFEPVLAISEVHDDVVARPARTAAPVATLAETRPAAVRSEPVVPAAPAAARRETAPATDALDGASIYIAYGRFNEALGILREGLQNEPNRTDLRVRMLEVLGQQGDASGFAEQEQALRAGGYSEPALEQIRARYPKLAPAVVPTPAPAPAAEPAAAPQHNTATTAAAAAGVIAAGVAAAEALRREPTPLAEAQEQLPVAPELEPGEAAAHEEPLDLDIDDFPDLGSFDETLQMPAEPEPLPESFDEFQLNLDDLSLDADWEMVSPFDTPARPKAAPEAPAAPPEVDHEFASNLKELPEVFEMPDEQFLSDFADPQLQVDIEPGLQDELGTPHDPDQEALDNAFLDSFIADADLPELDALTVDFDDLERQQESAEKLERAQSFIEHGDFVQASDLLLDLLREGDDACKHSARQLLSSIS
jgi:FimV-like protein